MVMNLGFPAPVMVMERLEQLPGLRRVRLDSVKGSVWVDYDPAKVSVNKIRGACSLPGSNLFTV